jgi:hypothetical protein
MTEMWETAAGVMVAGSQGGCAKASGGRSLRRGVMAAATTARPRANLAALAAGGSASDEATVVEATVVVAASPLSLRVSVLPAPRSREPTNGGQWSGPLLPFPPDLRHRNVPVMTRG